MVRVHRAIAVVSADQSVTVPLVPLPSGQRVEVILRPAGDGAATVPEDIRRRLRGSVLKYDEPFGPAVPPGEWDALR